MKRLVAAALALALVAACGGDGDDRASSRRRRATTTTEQTTLDTSTSSTSTSVPAVTTTRRRSAGTTAARGTTSTGGAPPDVNVRVRATRVAQLTRPIALAVRPGEPNNVYIAQKGGNVRRLRLNGNDVSVESGEVMDIAGRISTGGEQGLLGIAFSADGNTLYASYTDTAGDSRIVAYPYAGGRANIAMERLILGVDQPYANHNGGQITFGPDGLLYVALGDGGAGGDPQDRAQNLGTLLGKILRIRPNPSGGYTVPADNPFVNQNGRLGEIWHFGLRNPWRWSFDRATGEQWIADVGQGAYEEVNRVGAGVKGVNFGWNRREGKHPYNGGSMPPGAVDPVYEYANDSGNCAITGGYVYRGSTIPDLRGVYLFGDYCRGEITAALGGTVKELGVRVEELSSFGEDASGEVWVLSLSGGVYRLAPV